MTRICCLPVAEEQNGTRTGTVQYGTWKHIRVAILIAWYSHLKGSVVGNLSSICMDVFGFCLSDAHVAILGSTIIVIAVVVANYHLVHARCTCVHENSHRDVYHVRICTCCWKARSISLPHHSQPPCMISHGGGCCTFRQRITSPQPKMRCILGK